MFSHVKILSVILAILLLPSVTATIAPAADLSFSDPAAIPLMPSWAVGQAHRSADLDAMPGFHKPPLGFGIVPFFWWLGDPLTKERLHWEMEQMAGMNMSGFQINYAHSDKGGHSYGLTYPSEPPLFSEDWWNLTGWFLREAKKQGASISLSDYTLGFGQGWYIDEVLKENPDLKGAVLEYAAQTAVGGQAVFWELPAGTLAVTAYRLEGTNITPNSEVDLRPQLHEGKLRWEAPPGSWQMIAVFPKVVPWSLDPMNRMAGPKIIEKFFHRFENRFPGESGKGLNFFFSDELQFGVSGNLWTDRLAEEFRKRKGYDLVPELPALFAEIGPRTPKVRLDYRDVMVALTEEGYFRPLFDWHQARGMTYGCDHGGRGRDVIEFGDYFRTQRWNQGPGSDQPQLGKDLIKAKVASSIAHLYQRPRVWLEGYYGSGWGTSSADIVDATFANFTLGYNLLSFHGMYYSTHGGWWEWAPPDNTFRMPYWKHLRDFTACMERLSYLLSQGDHRCDVAILYPVATMEAGMDGQTAVQTAFHAGEELYAKSIDFDFMDFESLARARVVGKELHVSGEIYRVLILPAMKAVRHSTLQKALEFHRAGGVVLALGELPEASDRVGRNDPEVAAIVKELFPNGAEKDLFARLPERDYEGPGYILHRKIGPRDLYAIYNAPKGSECRFRASGKVELWDPWTGTTSSLAVVSQTDGRTSLKLPLTEKEIQLIVFSPGQTEISSELPNKPAEIVPIEGEWEFELQPTLDNRYGDFHWPPTPTLVGAEVRQLEYCEGENATGPWRKVTCSFGPQFLESEKMPVNPNSPPADGRAYEFSWRWGVEHDPGHQGYHGLKAEMHDEFLVLGRALPTATGTSYELDGKDAYLWTTVVAPREMTAYALTGPLKPSGVWLNGAKIDGKALKLKAGSNSLLLHYDKAGRTYFVISTKPDAEGNEAAIFSPETRWIWYPNDQTLVDCWFRKTFDLKAAPRQAHLRITCDNGYAVSINGVEIGIGNSWETIQEYDVAKALRIGQNEIVVHARNDGGDAGLIAELTADKTRIATDDSWRVSKTANGETLYAKTIADFPDSLWHQHPQGPPKLEPLMTGVQPKFKSTPLAMQWWNNANVLPFDVRPNAKSPFGWYRFLSPPGLQALQITARGKVQAWVDGKPLDGSGTFTVPQPSAAPVMVLLRIDQERGYYGGAALPEPIRLDCRPGRITLGDWSKNDALLSYSGGAWYRKTVNIPTAKQVTLNLGTVAASAEIRVNGHLADTKVSPPWEVDITRFIQPGDNRIEVLVYNTLANHYTTIPTRYRGSTVSGLLGPVVLSLIR